MFDSFLHHNMVFNKIRACNILSHGHVPAFFLQSKHHFHSEKPSLLKHTLTPTHRTWCWHDMWLESPLSFPSHPIPSYSPVKKSLSFNKRKPYHPWVARGIFTHMNGLPIGSMPARSWFPIRFSCIGKIFPLFPLDQNILWLISFLLVSMSCILSIPSSILQLQGS